MSFDVVLADAALAEEIYRFRYKIYVEHMGRRQLYADHVSRRIEEPFDKDGFNFAAVRNGEVVGTIRGNKASDASMTYYRNLFRLDKVNNDMSSINVTTKLMVRPDLSGTTTGPRLIEAYTSYICKNGAQVGIIDCNKHLIPFFERIGFFSYMGWAFHKEYGTVRPMVIALDTLQYLSAIRSVIFQAAKSNIQDGAYGGYDLIRRIGQSPALLSVKAWFDTIFYEPMRVAAE